jgi:outer membrane protease
MKCSYIFAASGANPSRRTLYAKRIARISFLALLLAIPPGLTAQEQPVNKGGPRFSIGVSLGLLHGQGEEIVYWDEGSDRKLSQLLWDIKPLGYAGVDVGLDWQKQGSRWGFFTGSDFKFGFPGKNGVMVDRDWRGANYPDWLTNYSEHDNRTDSALLIDADFGMSFRLSESFLLKAYIVYTYMSFSWTASGGSFLYPAGGHWFEEPTGSAVTYQQSWHIISPALAFYGKFNRYFDIELSLKASPFIWCVADDNHPIKNIHFTDTMEYGFFIEPKLVFSYIPKDYFSLSLSVSYRDISGTRGDTDERSQGKPAVTFEDEAGAGYRAFDIGLSAKFIVDIPRIWQLKK